jgi:hypothetical protein
MQLLIEDGVCFLLGSNKMIVAGSEPQRCDEGGVGVGDTTCTVIRL